MTNSVGEFVFFEQEQLNDVVQKRPKPTDETYSLLRSRHFLIEASDFASIELLGLKTRKKFSNLRHFTNLHIFVVSLRCGHSCPSCQVSRQSENKAAFGMTVETADKALAIVFRSPNPAIEIESQGGEPLLNFELIRHVVIKAKEINEVEKRDPQFVIATTLSLITDKALDFCKDPKIFLSSSLDGPEDLQNRNRPRPGKDSVQQHLEVTNE